MVSKITLIKLAKKVTDLDKKTMKLFVGVIIFDLVEKEIINPDYVEGTITTCKAKIRNEKALGTTMK